MKGADSKPSVTDNVQLEESQLFTPYGSFVELLGANPAMDGVTVLGSDVERRVMSTGERDYIYARLACMSAKKPDEEIGSVLAQLSLFRYRKNVSFEEFRKNAKRAVYDDFEKVYSDLHLVDMWTGSVKRCERGYTYDLAGGLLPKGMDRIDDGIYIVCLDVGGARMYRDAKFAVYGFYRDR